MLKVPWNVNLARSMQEHSYTSKKKRIIESRDGDWKRYGEREQH